MWGGTVVMRTICSFSIVLALLATSGLPLQGSLRSEGLRQGTKSPRFLFLRASVSTAGPYGEAWSLTITFRGEASLEVMYMLQPSGSLLGRFTVTDKHLASIAAAIDKEQFFALPGKISAERIALHQPDLELEVTVGTATHKVRLYDPQELADDRRTKQFLSVWERVFEAFPIKPKW
jgi:hypothetical protein